MKENKAMILILILLIFQIILWNGLGIKIDLLLFTHEFIMMVLAIAFIISVFRSSFIKNKKFKRFLMVSTSIVFIFGSLFLNSGLKYTSVTSPEKSNTLIISEKPIFDGRSCNFYVRKYGVFLKLIDSTFTDYDVPSENPETNNITWVSEDEAIFQHLTFELGD